MPPGRVVARRCLPTRTTTAAALTFAVPKYVSRGEDIHRVACVVIGARERMERSKGLGA
jgi:hypothetical protein